MNKVISFKNRILKGYSRSHDQVALGAQSWQAKDEASTLGQQQAEYPMMTDDDKIE